MTDFKLQKKSVRR